MTFYWYRDGTVTVTNGSTAIVGVDTLWDTAVRDGDEFSVDGATWYEFNPLTDTTATLNRAYAGATAGAIAYYMRRSSPERDAISNASRDLSDFLTTYRDLINVSGSDRYFTLNKTLSTDLAGIWFKQGGASKFRAGLFENNNYQIQYLVASTWTVAISVDPTTGAVSFGGGTATTAGDFAGSAAAVSIFDNRVYAAGRGGSLLLQGYDAHSSPERTTWASLQGVGTDGTQSSEDGDLVLSTMRAGALTNAWKIQSTGGLVPTTSDGAALGSASLMVSDLFLASGAVINWANGEVTITETSANLLTIAGGVVAISDTTNSTSTIGALTVAGGVAIALSLHIGGFVGIGGAANRALSINTTGNGAYVSFSWTATEYWLLGHEHSTSDQFAIYRPSGGSVTRTLAISTAGAVRLFDYGAGALSTDANGNITASDEKLKNIEGPYSRGLDEILAINPIKFEYKKALGRRTAGFSAQNVIAALPEAEGRIPGDDENPDGYLNIVDRAVIAALVNATKTIHGRLGVLESRIC